MTERERSQGCVVYLEVCSCPMVLSETNELIAMETGSKAHLSQHEAVKISAVLLPGSNVSASSSLEGRLPGRFRFSMSLLLDLAWLDTMPT